MSKNIKESQTTQFTAYPYDFEWNLKNCELIFSMATAAKSFKSESFSLNKSNVQVFLTLDIDNKRNLNDELCGSTLTVHLTPSSGTPVKLLIKVLIVSFGNIFNSEWNTVIVKQQDVTTSFTLPSQNGTAGNSPSSLKRFVQNNKLTFQCIVRDIRESCTSEKTFAAPDTKMKMATDMFTSFYRNNELFDVTLITGNERIQAHALVLSAISPYFRKMFSSGMKEERERTVDFSKDDEITPKILRGLLDYIYGVKSVDELKDIARHLLTLALKFDIENLKKPCEFIVSNGINKTNVASTLLFAHKYDLRILKEKALGISKIHMKYLKASKEFEEICQQVDLVKELM